MKIYIYIYIQATIVKDKYCLLSLILFFQDSLLFLSRQDLDGKGIVFEPNN